MKSQPPAPGRSQALLQYLGEALRAAEPDLGRPGAILAGSQLVSGEFLTLPQAVHLQPDAEKRRAQGLDPGDEGIDVAVASAVVQLGSRGIIGPRLQ